MDWRLLIVFGPLLIALGWAGFNIFAAALNQFQNTVGRK
ncbi:MAG: photosystem II protein Y [Spirulina sp. SIO3F2]|nr:photosystem II protein Y [Spirulina sp. SIO3F2]